MAKIEIEGKKYKVMETMGYHQAGMPAKFVETPDGLKIAVKRGDVWTWWTAKDRLGRGTRATVSEQTNERRKRD